MAGQLADGRFALDGDEVLVVIDVELRFGRIDDVPDDDGGDFDRIAAGVVDLDLFADEVGDAEGHPVFGAERIGPVESGRPGRADVPADKGENHGFVGIKDEKARYGQADEKHAAHAEEKSDVDRRIGDVDEERQGESDDDDVDRQNGPSADLKYLFFLDIDHVILLRYRNDIIMIFSLSRGFVDFSQVKLSN